MRRWANAASTGLWTSTTRCRLQYATGVALENLPDAADVWTLGCCRAHITELAAEIFYLLSVQRSSRITSLRTLPLCLDTKLSATLTSPTLVPQLAGGAAPPTEQPAEDPVWRLATSTIFSPIVDVHGAWQCYASAAAAAAPVLRQAAVPLVPLSLLLILQTDTSESWLPPPRVGLALLAALLLTLGVGLESSSPAGAVGEGPGLRLSSLLELYAGSRLPALPAKSQPQNLEVGWHV